MGKMTNSVLAVLVLFGCATTTTVSENMAKGLDIMVGHPLEVATMVLGYPDGKQDIVKGRTAYYWIDKQHEMTVRPAFGYTTGTLDTQDVSLRTTKLYAVPTTYECMIKVVVDQDDTIVDYDFNGQRAGCKDFIDRLNKLIEANEVIQSFNKKS